MALFGGGGMKLFKELVISFIGAYLYLAFVTWSFSPDLSGWKVMERWFLLFSIIAGQVTLRAMIKLLE